MTSFDGHKAIWMWEFSAQAEKTWADAAYTARNLAGCDVLLAKAMDGQSFAGSWDAGNVNSAGDWQSVVALLAGLGVTAIPWVVPSGLAWQEEASLHAALGPVLMVDVEPYPGFWVGSIANLRPYLQALRAGGVAELHIAIDPRASAVQALGGVADFADLVDGIHGEVYWTDFSAKGPLQASHEARLSAIAGAEKARITGARERLLGSAPPLSVIPMLQALQLGPPVYPILPGIAAAGDVATAWQAAQAIGCTGVAAWRLGSMDAGQLSAFAALPVAQPSPQPGPDVASAQGRLATMQSELVDLRTALNGGLALLDKLGANAANTIEDLNG